jgi:hypothetical protein
MDTSNERSVSDNQGADASGESFWRPVETPSDALIERPAEASEAMAMDAWSSNFADTETSAPAQGQSSAMASPTAAIPGWDPVGADHAPAEPAPSMSWAPSEPVNTPNTLSTPAPQAPMMAAGLSGLGSFSASQAPQATQAPTLQVSPWPETQTPEPMSHAENFASTPVDGVGFSSTTSAASFPASFEVDSTSFEPVRATGFDPVGSGFDPVGSGFDSPAEQSSFEPTAFAGAAFEPVAFDAAPIEPGSFVAPAASWSPVEASLMSPQAGLTPAAAALLGKPVPGAHATSATTDEEPKSRFGRAKKAKSTDEFGSAPKPAKSKEPKAEKTDKTTKTEKVKKSKNDDALVSNVGEGAKKSRFSRGEKAAKVESERASATTSEGGSRFSRKFVIPGAMALVGLLGGGGYVALSGGSPSATGPISSVPVVTPASEAPASSTPGGSSAETTVAGSAGVPDDLALTDPAPASGALGDDELGFETPIEPIQVVEEPDPTELDSAAPVATAPVTTAPIATEPVAAQPVATQPVATKPVATQPASASASAPAPVDPSAAPAVTNEPVATVVTTAPAVSAAPLAVGRFQTASCVKVVGEVNDRTRRVSNASVTQTDCQMAHNAEIVALFSPEQSCETAAIAFVGYPDRVKTLDGTVVAYALVQDKADNQSYCVASFPTMPDYTGQLYGSKTVQ